MKLFNILGACTAVAVGFGSTTGAIACAKSNIIGTWDDSYGAVATITSLKGGTATAPSIICSNGATYNVVVNSLTLKKAKFTGTATGCPTVTATLAYAKGSCTKASGPLVVSGLGTLQDTWTKVSAIRHSAVATSTLSDGLR